MILCADDYGQNHAVSDGILHLIQAQKVNSVSCLVTSNCWKKRAPDLKPFLQNIEIGLHLTLTDPKPVHLPGQSLKSLAVNCYLKKLNKKDIVQEIETQMELFKEAMGRLPDYVDGHEFCHHFPIVREALMETAEKFQFQKNHIYIRVFQPHGLPLLKNGIFWVFNHLASTPSKKLAKLLKRKNISFNSRLLGFHPYALNPKKYFDYYFGTTPSKKDIFFCHPGLPSDDSSDNLRDYRPKVYDFMMSSQFDNMLKSYNITLNTFKQAMGSSYTDPI